MQHNDGLTSDLDERIDALAANLKSVVDHLAHVQGRARARAASFMTKAGRVIEDHPFAALAIGLGVGYLIVRLMRR
jgi:ElaB/YqjD/DUF883 family membrane-anchored ribosome-binding protein